MYIITFVRTICVCTQKYNIKENDFLLPRALLLESLVMFPVLTLKQRARVIQEKRKSSFLNSMGSFFTRKCAFKLSNSLLEEWRNCYSQEQTKVTGNEREREGERTKERVEWVKVNSFTNTSFKMGTCYFPILHLILSHSTFILC